MMRPTCDVLWEGIPLQELGIADALVEATFTETVGRSTPSKKFANGKPKVGSASLKFALTDRNVAQAITRLLHRKERPTLSIGFGYEDGEAFWVGAFGPGRPSNSKDFKRVGAFKLDKPTWNYDSGAVASVTLAGMTDKAVGMAEQMRPAVYNDTTMRRILEGIANEHGVTLEVDPDFDLSVRLKNVMKTSRESSLEFLYRLLDMVGATNVEFEQTLVHKIGDVLAHNLDHTASVGGVITQGFDIQAAAAKGAPRAVGYDMAQRLNKARRDSGIFYNSDEVNATAFTANTTSDRDARNTIRTILRIRKIQGYQNMGQLEQVKPLLLGFGAFLSRETKQRVIKEGFLVKSVSISEEGYKGGGMATPAKTKLDNGQEAVPSAGLEQEEFVTRPGAPLVTGASKQKGAKRNARAGAIPNQTGYLTIISTLPDEMAAGARFASDQLRAVALCNGFGFSVSVECFPGLPFLIPNMRAELVGTDCHDGLYGCEESSWTWGGGGLSSKHVLQPTDVRVGSGNGGKSKKAGDDGPVPSAGLEEETFVTRPGQGFFGNPVTKKPTPVMQEQEEPVPYE